MKSTLFTKFLASVYASSFLTAFFFYVNALTPLKHEALELLEARATRQWARRPLK